MSSIPGIDTRAPERTETSSGCLGIAEHLAGALLERGQRLVDLLGQAVGQLATGLHVGDAGLGRDREAGGHPLGAQHPGHLGDAGALAAEQLALIARALGELTDPPHRAGPASGKADRNGEPSSARSIRARF